MGCDAGEIEAKAAVFPNFLNAASGDDRNVRAIDWDCHVI
jgi:hypothetical protein